MLQFMRKHQRYFFIFISIAVIVSFSFFGTYNTLSTDGMQQKVAFVAVDGTKVSRADLDEMVVFLSTDTNDKLLFGGIWGPNFLNDGVLKQDILETGIAQILANQYSDQIRGELSKKFEKERRFVTYAHPGAKFLSANQAWNYFAPEINTSLEVMKSANEPTKPEIFDARVQLFLAERKFPSPLLQQVLRYQEKQYSWIPPDPNLEQADLSLFGYHTLEDWFGPRFMRIMCEFIINSSKVAEQKGYVVSKEEVVADLIGNAAKSFQQNLNNPQLGVSTPTEYFNEQLRRMGMDQTRAIKVWKTVMLFRRLFEDVGNAVLIDPLAYDQFYSYAHEMIEGELYQLPKDLHFKDQPSLLKFEVYLNAVSKRGDTEKALLIPPVAFLSVEEVSKIFPELVQKRYLVEISHLNKPSLQSRIGLKETWDWEITDQNWEKLQKQFPDLGVKVANSKEERFNALDGLDEKTRNKVDEFARSSIVEAHPEWVDEVLTAAPSKTLAVGLKVKGGASPFLGLQNAAELMQLLDVATLKDEPSNTAAQQLFKFTADQKNIYRIQLIERAPSKEILTFAQANREGILDPLVERELEAYYQKIRAETPEKFQKEDKSWKPFQSVRELVADRYLERLSQAIQKNYVASIAPEKAPPIFIKEFLASLRLYAYVREIKSKIEKNSQEEAAWTKSKEESPSEENVGSAIKLEDQWKLEKGRYSIDRSSDESVISQGEAHSLHLDQWSKVHTPASGDLNFFHLLKREASKNPPLEKLDQLRLLVADDAQRNYTRMLIHEIKDKHAISLEYLNAGTESMGPEE